MLSKLSIKNFALIEKSEIEFSSGLNILSGETGSGKSIILEALNFVLGAKADKDLIKNGESECFVSAEFDISKNEKIKNILSEFDFEIDDSIIIARKMTVDGKNSIKLNGNSVTLSMLRKITQHLVDIHGQSEHFYLLNSANQLELIDKFGEDNIVNIKNELAIEVDKYHQIIDDIDKLGGDENSRLTKLDILNFQIEEISKSNLADDEEEKLIEIRKKLQNREKILLALSSTKEGISGEGGVFDILSNLTKMLGGISEYSSNYADLFNRLSNAFVEIEDISHVSESIIDSFEEEEYRLDEVEERLQLIKNLKRKYGNSIEEIKAYLDNALREKSQLENFNELYSDLIIKQEKQQKVILSFYKKLHNERVNSANKFTKNVICELKELGFLNSEFIVKFYEIDENNISYIHKNGIDNIEFLFSANVGEPAKALSNVISGGEISRFMLAIKAQSSKYSDINTYIFDEIDAGISGETAKVVAKKFYKISRNTQIIAITHLPQIAVMGDINFYIYKVVEKGKTFSKIDVLDNLGKNNEIIRLMGGSKDSKNAIELAKEMIEQANISKNNIL